MCYIANPLPLHSLWLLSPPWPPPLLLLIRCFHFLSFLLPHSYGLRSSILVQPSCLPSPLPSCFSRSIILASHSEQKHHQSNWFCRCAEEPHQLTDWVSRLASPSGPLYFFLSLSQLLPLFSFISVSSLFAFCFSSVLLSLSIATVAVFLWHIPSVAISVY